MVKFASTLVVAALVAAPISVFASSWEELDSRDLSEQSLFFGRDLANTDTGIVFARETDELFSRVVEELDARDIDVQELSERSKIGRFFKKMWHGIKKVASVVIRREDEEDELLARSADLDLDELFERYIEEIDERSPGFGSFMKNGMTHVKHEAHSHNRNHPVAHSVARHAAHAAVSYATQSDRREIDDLVERDAFEDSELYGREYEDEDIFGREFEFDFDERDFDELDELD